MSPWRTKKEVEDEIKQLESKIKKLRKSLWPQKNTRVWGLDSQGHVVQFKFNSVVHAYNLSIGMVQQTKEEIEKWLVDQKMRTKVERGKED